MTISLALDFGSQNIGVALVRQDRSGGNIPLFAGTLKYDPIQLKKKLNARPQLRRIRRTRKTKRARLRRLEHSLSSIGLSKQLVQSLVSYCRRRGWKSLYDTESDDQDLSSDEILFRYSREEFFNGLETKIEQLVPKQTQDQVLSICENILNRFGDPLKEQRQMRIDNRGVSRCAWEGCDSVTPRRENAIKDALAQFVCLIIDLEPVRKDPLLKARIDTALLNLEAQAKRLRHAGGKHRQKKSKDAIKAERKALLAKIRAELKIIKDLANDETWSTNRANIMNIIDKSSGRNRYCRKHSEQFVLHQLKGQAIPFKNALTEKDIVSRREEVLFQRIWRYIEARILPLAPGKVDRLVIERVAFDLLAGTWRQRQTISDKALEAMYQQGPRLGFKSDLDMLRSEFDGLCAYCGQASDTLLEREHILPRKSFIFDSYLNLLPACADCNRQRKAGRTAAGALLTVSKNAFDAYAGYLDRKFKNKPKHYLHTIKKGILKLMCDENRVWEAEQYLALVSDNLINVTSTQRGPRPLARYLAHKIKLKYSAYPVIRFSNGRHTALWRQVCYPDFDKAQDKAKGSSLNHAVDALVLGCKLPSPAMLEAANLPVKEIKSWAHSVQQAAPAPGPDGIPLIRAVPETIDGFELVLPGNYVEIDLSFFNWNRRDSAVQRQDIYGWNQHVDLPTRRTAAAQLVAEFIEADKSKSDKERARKIAKVVDNVIHPHLKVTLSKASQKENPGTACAVALIEWIRKSLKGSLEKARFSDHQADQQRKKILEEFIEGKFESIPITVGIKMLRPHDKGAVDLGRVERKNGNLIHRYRSDPGVIGKIVGYKKNGGHVDRGRPLVFDWRQSWAIKAKHKKVEPVPDGPLKGRAYGQSLMDEKVWRLSLERYLSVNGIVEYTIIRQGNVAVYEDGRKGYIRNFSSTQGFKGSMLKHITAIQRSPFANKVLPNVIISDS